MSWGFSDYPLSVFRDALRSTVGRLLSFYLAVGLGCAVCLSLWGLVEHGVDFGHAHPLSMLLAPVLFVFVAPSGLFLGISQGWGFIALLALGVIFVYHFYQESPAGRTLPLAALVAWLEVLRALVQEAGLEHALESQCLVALGAWVVATALYAVYILRNRQNSKKGSRTL